MQVYRLEPKNGDTTHRNWDTTQLKERCWVLAESEVDARLKVALITGIAVRLPRNERFPISPWINRDLTECVPDNTSGHEVPKGFIITASKKIRIRTPLK
jgi:hypothetical protein